MQPPINVSVVVPTYNRSKTISYCIESILTQTFKVLEIIIVDDCSTDDTVKIARNLGSEKIRVIQLENKSGAQVARNVGIKNATGNWIAFQDSDDKWADTKIEKQIRELEKLGFNEHVVIHTNCVTYSVTTQKYSAFNIPVVEGKNVYKDLLIKPGPLFPTILTSKNALEKIGYLDENVPSYQEWDISIQLSSFCEFVHIKEDLFIYFLHEGETISKDFFKNVSGYNYIRKKHKQAIISEVGFLFFHLDVAWNIVRAATMNLKERTHILANNIYESNFFLTFTINILIKNRRLSSIILRIIEKLRNITVKL